MNDQQPTGSAVENAAMSVENPETLMNSEDDADGESDDDFNVIAKIKPFCTFSFVEFQQLSVYQDCTKTIRRIDVMSKGPKKSERWKEVLKLIDDHLQESITCCICRRAPELDSVRDQNRVSIRKVQK